MNIEVVAAANVGPKGPPGSGNSVWLDAGDEQPERGYIDVRRPLKLTDDEPGNAHVLTVETGTTADKVAAGNHLHTGTYDPAGTGSTEAATALLAAKAYTDTKVAQQIAALIASAPGALDTLNELAQALNNDPSFATTMTTALAGKQAHSDELDTIAALDPADDDLLQRKSGLWVARTPAQVKADLAVTAADVGALATSTRGAASGVASLDASSLVPSTQLPTVPLTKGGTGQTTAAAGFDALAPTTTKGDLVVRSSSTNTRRAVSSTDGEILAALSSDTTGLGWVKNAGEAIIADTGNYPITNFTNSNTRTKLWEVTITAGRLNKFGNLLRCLASGTYLNNTGGNVTHLVEWEITDGTLTRTLATAATNVATSASAKPYRFSLDLWCRAAGAAGTVGMVGSFTFYSSAEGTAGGHMTNWPLEGRQSASLDFTQALTLRVWLTWGSASTSLALNTGGGLLGHHLYAR